MRCPFCDSQETQVKDSRPTEENTAIRRRRFCSDCGARFTTFERVQLRDMVVVKRSGRKVPFDRDKLRASVSVALRKRPVEPERLEHLVSGIVRQLESSGETEITSVAIGELVMAALRDFDPVAYVRFASVYREFREVSDFADVLGEIARDARVDGMLVSAGESPAGRIEARSSACDNSVDGASEEEVTSVRAKSA